MARGRPDREDRLEKHYGRLGTHEPRCVLCGETDPRCLEEHHIAGHAYHAGTVIVCRNCHRKLSDDQLDHPPHRADVPPDQLTVIGRFLLGVCDLLVRIIQMLREFAYWLLNKSVRADVAP